MLNQLHDVLIDSNRLPTLALSNKYDVSQILIWGLLIKKAGQESIKFFETFLFQSSHQCWLAFRRAIIFSGIKKTEINSKFLAAMIARQQIELFEMLKLANITVDLLDLDKCDYSWFAKNEALWDMQLDVILASATQSLKLRSNNLQRLSSENIRLLLDAADKANIKTLDLSMNNLAHSEDKWKAFCIELTNSNATLDIVIEELDDVKQRQLRVILVQNALRLMISSDHGLKYLVCNSIWKHHKENTHAFLDEHRDKLPQELYSEVKTYSSHLIK